MSGGILGLGRRRPLAIDATPGRTSSNGGAFLLSVRARAYEHEAYTPRDTSPGVDCPPVGCCASHLYNGLRLRSHHHRGRLRRDRVRKKIWCVPGPRPARRRARCTPHSALLVQLSHPFLCSSVSAGRFGKKGTFAVRESPMQTLESPKIVSCWVSSVEY